MSGKFAGVLDEARCGVSLPKIAEAMAERSRPRRNARGVSANLYRLINSDQTPKRETIVEIADALGALRQLSPEQTENLQNRLLKAGRPEDAEADEKRSLRPICEKALRKKSDLSGAEVARILDGADLTTMKLIVAADKTGEPIVPLRIPTPENVISAGRARIFIDGEVSAGQRRIIQKAADLIESVLSA